ncbi:MAG: hypothetical protein H0W66_04540, partial [Chthoniobacterales bacterium]|nr:hypothetical protein [Chthoniobacterales bacterium]
MCLSGKAFRASLWENAPAAAKARKDKGKRAGFEKPLLIHYHIFKNAGTSFEWALRHGLGSGVHRLDMPRHDGFVSHNDIIRYVEGDANVKVLSSHQASPPAPRIEGRRVLTSILIRDPIARIRSIYEFERIQPSDAPGPVKAKAVDFRTYVEWRLTTTPRMLCN